MEIRIGKQVLLIFSNEVDYAFINFYFFYLRVSLAQRALCSVCTLVLNFPWNLLIRRVILSYRSRNLDQLQSVPNGCGNDVASFQLSVLQGVATIETDFTMYICTI